MKENEIIDIILREDEPHEETIHFNLRDAIIYSAILNGKWRIEN